MFLKYQTLNLLTVSTYLNMKNHLFLGVTFLMLSLGSISGQHLQVHSYNKEFKIEIANPAFTTHFPTGIIYQDTTGIGFANLSDQVLRIATRPIGFQFQPNNAIYSELTKNSFSINHFNGSSGILLIGPSRRAYWGPRSPGQLFPDYYDISTVGNIYNVDLSNRRMAELSIENNRGGLRLHRYSGDFSYVHTLSINDAGNPMWSAVSDLNAKTDIQECESVLSHINKLRLKSYKYKGSEIRSSGFIAQEVQVAFPDLVETNEQGLLSVNYMGFAPLAIQAINEQQEIIQKLIDRIEKLEKRMLEKDKASIYTSD